jgi:hypothetical protein
MIHVTEPTTATKIWNVDADLARMLTPGGVAKRKRDEHRFQMMTQGTGQKTRTAIMVADVRSALKLGQPDVVTVKNAGTQRTQMKS